jgi:RIO kinase 1
LGKNRENEQLEALDEFVGRALIDEVLGVIKSGKEATVYLCSAPSAKDGLLAAKVYRSRNVRGFADDSGYRQGRTRGMAQRDSRAIMQKSRVGREMAFAQWVSHEFETLRELHRAGCDVPEPIERADSVILMEYLGDDDGPAPPLANVLLEEAEARRLWGTMLRNIEGMLRCDRVHGDLSAFNVLYVNGALKIIDFPQAVDARFNDNAVSLLERDVDRVASYFGRFGVQIDAWRVARELWARFIRAEL